MIPEGTTHVRKKSTPDFFVEYVKIQDGMAYEYTGERWRVSPRTVEFIDMYEEFIDLTETPEEKEAFEFIEKRSAYDVNYHVSGMDSLK